MCRWQDEILLPHIYEYGAVRSCDPSKNAQMNLEMMLITIFIYLIHGSVNKLLDDGAGSPQFAFKSLGIINSDFAKYALNNEEEGNLCEPEI